MKSCRRKVVQKVIFLNTLGGNAKILETMKKLRVSSVYVLCGKEHDFRSRLLHKGCDAVDQSRPMFEARVTLTIKGYQAGQALRRKHGPTNLTTSGRVDLSFAASSAPLECTCANTSKIR